MKLYEEQSSPKKIVEEGEGFGRFDRPDFRDSKSWVSILFGKIPNIDLLSDIMSL